MSIEGGEFNCYRHDFHTSNVQQWDEHCNTTGHTLTVEQLCADCSEPIKKVIPYPKRYVEKAHTGNASPISLECPKCSQKVGGEGA